MGSITNNQWGMRVGGYAALFSASFSAATPTGVSGNEGERVGRPQRSLRALARTGRGGGDLALLEDAFNVALVLQQEALEHVVVHKVGAVEIDRRHEPHEQGQLRPPRHGRKPRVPLPLANMGSTGTGTLKVK